MKVYFNGGFWGHEKYQKPMKKLEMQRSFTWNGERWQLMAAYVCGKGMVLDFAKSVSVEAILRYWDKWKSVRMRQEQGQLPTESERSRMEYENPQNVLMYCNAWVNEREIFSVHGQVSGYSPSCLRNSEDAWDIFAESEEVEQLLSEYQLDPSCGWSFYRMTLVWPYKRIPKKLKVRLELLPESQALFCQQTFETVPGEAEKTISFTDPLDGTLHELVVEAVRQQELPERAFPSEIFGQGERYIFPRHFQWLKYRFTKAEDMGRFNLQDMEPGDSPICQVSEESSEPSGKAAAAVSIIGGADGPTSIFLAGRVREESEEIVESEEEVAESEDGVGASESLSQASRLCFEPVAKVRWQVIASVTRGEKMMLEL